MPISMLVANDVTHAEVATMEKQDTRLSESQWLLALPQPVLEMILVGTTSKDKKALRETCKLFQQLLDNSCVSMMLLAKETTVQLMQRMQSWSCLKAVMLIGPPQVSYNWLRLLPGQITTLTLFNFQINLLQLSELRGLTSLYICKYSKISGLQHVSGLTSLYAGTPVGSVAHLAPTLKNLRIQKFPHVQGMHLLTNLEVLKMRSWMPADFFQRHGNLPLQRLALYVDHCRGLPGSKEWEMAASTLTSLTLVNATVGLPTLPTSITHLQLLKPMDIDAKHVAAAVPGLRSLDIYSHHLSTFIKHLSELTNLQSLGLLGDYRDKPLLHNQDFLQLPDIANACARGVQLSTFTQRTELLGVFHGIHALRTSWATHF